MKILLTSDWYEPVVNGVVTSVRNLKRELEKRGHEVRVLTLSENRDSRKEGDVYYIHSHSAGLVYPNARVTLPVAHPYVQELMDWKPDIVHSQCEFTTFWFARRIAFRTGAPLIHTYHTIYEDYTHYFSPNKAMGAAAARLLSRKVLDQTDAVIAPTKKVKAILERYMVEPAIFTIPTGIDLAPFADGVREKQLRGNLIKLLTAVGLVLMCGFVVYGIAAGLFTSQQKMEVFLRPAGLWAPLLFTALQAIQVVIPILPGGIGCLGGVLMFGPVRGFLYNYVGICLGSVAAFLLSKRYGQPFVRSVAGERTYEKYAGWLEKGNRFDTFFALAIFFPVAPDDFLCYLAGLTRMSLKKFSAIIFLGKPASIALYSLGLHSIMALLAAQSV